MPRVKKNKDIIIGKYYNYIEEGSEPVQCKISNIITVDGLTIYEYAIYSEYNGIPTYDVTLHGEKFKPLLIDKLKYLIDASK